MWGGCGNNALMGQCEENQQWCNATNLVATSKLNLMQSVMITNYGFTCVFLHNSLLLMSGMFLLATIDLDCTAYPHTIFWCHFIVNVVVIVVIVAFVIFVIVAVRRQEQGTRMRDDRDDKDTRGGTRVSMRKMRMSDNNKGQLWV